MKKSGKITALISDDDEADLVIRLRKDIANAALTMSPKEARYLVDLYYSVAQKNRIRMAGQIRNMEAEPHETLAFLFSQAELIEGQIKRALDLWTRDFEPTKWARRQKGIGPVIAAGLRAHIDIHIATSPSKIWRFAGLDPTVKWNKKQKRPWNAALKRLCWIIGESFVKISGRVSEPNFMREPMIGSEPKAAEISDRS